jgi:hypothetical protein
MEKMECHMRVSGSPLTTQISYLRALRDLMENTGDIPENLSAERIKKHLSDLRLNLSSSGLNNHVCSIKYPVVSSVQRAHSVVSSVHSTKD